MVLDAYFLRDRVIDIAMLCFLQSRLPDIVEHGYELCHALLHAKLAPIIGDSVLAKLIAFFRGHRGQR